MRMRRLGAFLVPVLVLAVPGSAQQPRGEVTLYSAPNFGGAGYTITGPRTNITLPWQARSIRVARGERWQLCPRTQYRGNCVTFAGSATNIRRVVASARPLGATLPGPAPQPPIGGGGFGPSLRGMGAEFFAAPREGGRRVISASNGSPDIAKRSADRFCVNRGWNGSARQAQETVGGQNYLVDVLCTRTGY